MEKQLITDWTEFISHSIGTVKTKVCIKCGQDKPLSEYTNNSGRPYKRTACKLCEKSLKCDVDRLKATTPLPDEKHTCPICGCTEKEALGRGGKKHKTPWAFDHNHITQTFRGYICHTCNRTLGCFKDNIDYLNRALKYLKGE